jgi:MOSC N-terminal beta barrel domain
MFAIQIACFVLSALLALYYNMVAWVTVRYCVKSKRTTPIITQLYVYPIKSCSGVSVSAATITPLGFSYDRIYMLIEHKNEKFVPMTLRNHPKVKSCMQFC